MESRIIKHYGVKGMRWGVRKSDRRLRRVSRNEFKKKVRALHKKDYAIWKKAYDESWNHSEGSKRYKQLDKVITKYQKRWDAAGPTRDSPEFKAIVDRGKTILED
jgi:hypothetical protein